MAPSREELHRLVDEIPEELRREAYRRLEVLLGTVGQQRSRGDEWSGDGLLALAGCAEGPESLSSHHDVALDPQRGDSPT